MVTFGRDDRYDDSSSATLTQSSACRVISNVNNLAGVVEAVPNFKYRLDPESPWDASGAQPFVPNLVLFPALAVLDTML